VQSVSPEPHVFSGHGHDHHTIPPSIADGTCVRTVALGQVQRYRSSDGSRLFELEPLQPGFSRNIWLLPGFVSAQDSHAEIFRSRIADPSLAELPSSRWRANHSIISSFTRARPLLTICNSSAAARDRSITRPLTKGPRSLIRTITDRWLSR